MHSSWLAQRDAAAAAGFAWEDGENETTLTYDGRPALRYMHEPLDESSPEAREATIKPFHHVFSPDGETLLTKGPGGLYTHHRGLFFGFNKVTHGDDPECDVWHCRNGESQQHVGNWFARPTTTPPGTALRSSGAIAPARCSPSRNASST